MTPSRYHILNSFKSMVAPIATNMLSAWHRLFYDDRNFRYNMISRDVLWRSYGRLVVYDKSPITKYTLAVQDEKIFEIIIKEVPRLLNLKVTIMLVDFEEGKIILEHEF